ncbi:MAG: ThiF family adenylyltransferase [Nitrosomonadales bacterium]|nr:ThiF family adenylyltransferase [Nitrosomonadales bacterium]
MQVKQIYSDPLRNRTFAFLDGVLGPQRALLAMGRLAKLRIGIVGCGGIGSTIAYLLAGMGVRRFMLVDPDRVEKGNLTRQVLFQLSDVGKPKVDSLSTALQDRFGDFEIEKLSASALNQQAIRLLANADTIICAGDNPPDLAHRLRERIPKNVGIWACGYALGVSVVRPPSKVKARSSSTPQWESLPSGFAPSIGFQNFEIAARCCSLLTLGLCGDSKNPNSIYVHDYRDQC